MKKDANYPKPLDHEVSGFFSLGINFFGSNVKICAKTKGQEELLRSMEANQITYAVGPAGTGKTFLALAYAVSLLKKKSVKKIVLTRPPVESGANLGFLPGDLKEKLEPYTRPLLDNLEKIVGPAEAKRLMDTGIVSFQALNYMRGSTRDEFVILDEAQNCDRNSLIMFITRLGVDGKYIITGDPDQIDLKPGQSGYTWVMDAMKGIPGVGYANLTMDDCQRSPIVKASISAFREKSKNEHAEALAKRKDKQQAA